MKVGVKLLDTYESFTKGIKPAYLVTHMYEMDIVNKLKDQGYPHHFDDHEFGGSTIFFQTEEMKHQYITEMKKVGMNWREEIIITGKFLGYPPISSEFFVNASDDEELSKKRAAFDYYGYRFVGNIDDAEAITKWLWENVQAPVAGVEVEYNNAIKLIEPSVVTV